jgi:hypothetical protein
MDRAAAPLKKLKIAKVALAVGAATILWALSSVVIGFIQSVKTAEIRLWLPARIFASVPWFVAGIALSIRSLRGAVSWPRALATWAGGFLIGAPAIIIGASLYGGRGDTTFWVLNIVFSILFLVVGTLLLRVGFKH